MSFCGINLCGSENENRELVFEDDRGEESSTSCLGCLLGLVGCLLGSILILALFALVLALVVISGWSIFGTVILCIYGLTSFDKFADEVQNCVENSGDFRNDEFRRHHTVRLWIRLIYSLLLVASGMLSGALKPREDRFTIIRRVCTVMTGFLMVSICVTGEVVELAVWPFTFNYEMKNCTLSWYQVGVYLGWPWYTAVLVLYGILIVCGCLAYVCMGRRTESALVEED